MSAPSLSDPVAAPAIRRLCRRDAADYRAIRLATLACEPEFFGPSHDEEALRPLSEFAAVLDAATVYGAYVGGEIVGVIRFVRQSRLKEAHKGTVHGFFVQPERRGQGVGSALMATLLAEAREVVEQLTLSVVAGNVAAIALYRRFGFATYGIEPRARRSVAGYQDMVLMALSLAGPASA